MPAATILDPPARRMVCPNCSSTALVTIGTVIDVEGRIGVRMLKPGQSAAQMHNCSGLKGLLTPMVPEGQDCKVEAVEREDYVGDDIVRTDGDGRPIMAAVITRAEGSDCVVYAPTATNRRI